MQYIDLDLMKLILGINGDTLNTLIEFYIKSATQRVINIIGRDISETTTTIKTNGNDSNILWLDLKPIQNITSVILNGENITSEVIVKDFYIMYKNGFSKKYNDIVKTSSYSGEYYSQKIKTENITIEGTFGYSEIPTDIQDVVSNIVQNTYVKSGICPQVKKQTDKNEFGEESKEFFNIINDVDISDEDMKTLLKYR